MKCNFLGVLLVTVLCAESIFSQSLDNQNGDELMGVAVCFRHGNRAPITSYPNDPYYDLKYWPDGFAQLLDEGKVNQFKVGQWLRSRYNGFLSQRYSPNEILVRSTDVDRTLASAASNLAGLYYPKDQAHPNWPEVLPWNPIPIHTEKRSKDYVLAMAKKCNKYDKMYTKVLNSEFLARVLKEHEHLKTFVESKTGWNITGIEYFRELHSIFYVYKMHNTSYVPTWAYELDQKELEYLAGLSYSIETFSPDLQRLKVGPFFNYLNKFFDGVIDGNTPKFLMLSGHDGDIVAVLNSYSSYDYHPPEFCAMIIWELYKNSTGDFYLKIWYRENWETESLKEIQIGDCSGACTYSHYKDVLKPITIDKVNRKEECN